MTYIWFIMIDLCIIVIVVLSFVLYKMVDIISLLHSWMKERHNEQGWLCVCVCVFNNADLTDQLVWMEGFSERDIHITFKSV